MALVEGRFLGFAVAQLLLVTRDQVDAVIDGQADEDGHERDRQDVEVPDRQAWRSASV